MPWVQFKSIQAFKYIEVTHILKYTIVNTLETQFLKTNMQGHRCTIKNSKHTHLTDPKVISFRNPKVLLRPHLFVSPMKTSLWSSTACSRASVCLGCKGLGAALASGGADEGATCLCYVLGYVVYIKKLHMVSLGFSEIQNLDLFV